MTDILILLFTAITVTASIGAHYYGKMKGKRIGYQLGWVDGMKDTSALETALRNEIQVLKETINRFTVEQIPAKKKVGRPKLK